MTVEPVRFGLVGYGSGGRLFHAPLIASADNCQLAGVVTNAPERKSLVAAEHPGTPVLASLRDLVAAGAEAVAISTPADTHSRLTDEALALGLHVVCDKPFALDAVSAARSVDLARDVGRLLAPYQNRRWDSDFLTARSLITAGALGNVTRLESRFERFAPTKGPGAAGGGTLLDFGSHLVDQALVLLGRADSVYAEWTIHPSGRDDDVFVAITHEGGARSHVWCSSSQPAPSIRFRVIGTEAAYVVNGPMDGQEDALRSGRSPRSLGDGWGAEPEERWGQRLRGATSERVPTERGRWDTFYPAFADAVRGIGDPPVPAVDAIATAVVLDAARHSVLTGQVIRVDRYGSG